MICMGQKIPLPLGFSSPEALYLKIDLHLCKAPPGDWLCMAQTQTRSPCLQVAVTSRPLKHLPCLELQPNLASRSRLESSLRAFSSSPE